MMMTKSCLMFQYDMFVSIRYLINQSLTPKKSHFIRYIMIDLIIFISSCFCCNFHPSFRFLSRCSFCSLSPAKFFSCDKEYLNSRFCIIHYALRSGSCHLHNFLSSHILTIVSLIHTHTLSLSLSLFYLPLSPCLSLICKHTVINAKKLLSHHTHTFDIPLSHTHTHANARHTQPLFRSLYFFLAISYLLHYVAIS
jgi:hypothetical protein